VLGLDVGAAELAGVVTRKEDDPPAFSCIVQTLTFSALYAYSIGIGRFGPQPFPDQRARLPGAAPGRSGGRRTVVSDIDRRETV